MLLTSLIPPLLADITQPEAFAPSPETLEWMRNTFFDSKSKFYNPAHEHLIGARLGVLWTNAPNSKNGKPVVGTAEMGKPTGSMSKWAKARFRFQLEQWFGEGELDFLITLHAPYLAGCDEANFFSTAEHELYHCGHQTDEFGPKFHKDGTPVYAIRGHDVEEFVGIIERYGPNAGAGDTRAFVNAAKRKPLFSGKRIEIYCGTCA